MMAPKSEGLGGISGSREPSPSVSALTGFDPGRKTWTLDEAVAICVAVEEACPPFGCHVALTGGTLYKRGARKDLDLLFYRIRQEPEIDMDGLWAELALLGIEKKSGFGWCFKAEFMGRKIDCFFPEEASGEYDDGDSNIIELIDFSASAIEAASADKTENTGLAEGESAAPKVDAQRPDHD